MTTFGPAYEPAVDHDRLSKQMGRVLEYMLHSQKWKTLPEICGDLFYIHETYFPEASVSAQLRHLRKQRFGGYIVEKRRLRLSGLWEYRVMPPKPNETTQLSLLGRAS